MLEPAEKPFKPDDRVKIREHYSMEGYKAKVWQLWWISTKHSGWWYVGLNGGVIAVASHALELDK
jgi:hypothetical protein